MGFYKNGLDCMSGEGKLGEPNYTFLYLYFVPVYMVGEI
jgi:hypothetical protein